MNRSIATAVSMYFLSSWLVVLCYHIYKRFRDGKKGVTTLIFCVAISLVFEVFVSIVAYGELYVLIHNGEKMVQGTQMRHLVTCLQILAAQNLLIWSCLASNRWLDSIKSNRETQEKVTQPSAVLLIIKKVERNEA